MMIKAPIVVDARGDMLLFSGVDMMVSYLEAIDVQKNEYLAYDSEGRAIALTTVKEPRSHLFGLVSSTAEVVKVAEVEAVPSHSDALAATVRDFLARIESVPPETAELATLIRLLETKIGFTV
jgi:hypothetical protein